MTKSIRKVLFRHIGVFSFTVFLLLGYFSYVTILNLNFKIAEDVAQESSSVISSELDAIINRELYVALNLSKSKQVIDWLKEEDSQDKEREALSVFATYLEDLRDDNIFIASEKTKNFYFVEDTIPNEMEALYVLDQNLDTDDWYFMTRDTIDEYDLNVDVDRFLETIRIWININIYDGDEYIGIIGTGIELNTIFEEVLSTEENYNSQSIVFDSYGAIQLTRDLSRIQENSFGEVDEDKSIFSMSQAPGYKEEIVEYIKSPSKNRLIELHKDREFMILTPIENTDWFIGTYYNTGEIISFRDFIWLLLHTFGLFIVFIIGLNWIIRRKVINPLVLLSESLSHEDYYGLERQDEIGLLSNTIRGMNQQLISYSHELEDKYKLQTDLLESFMDKASLGVVKIDGESKILSCNQQFLNIIGRDQPKSLINILSDKVDIQLDLIESGKLVMMCPMSIGDRWLELQVLSSDMDNAVYDLMVTDVTEKKIYEIELERLVSLDQLTGISNRRRFEQIVGSELYRLNRYANDLSIMMFDIDYFKKINDRYGHQTGDRILKILTKVTSKELRESDHFARWGGEEFLILLTNTNLENAIKKAEHLRNIIAHYDFGLGEKVTASFGVTEFCKGELYEDVFKRVDTALYYAKEKGRNRVEVG